MSTIEVPVDALGVTQPIPSIEPGLRWDRWLYQRFGKRAIDLAVAGLGMIPALSVIAVAAGVNRILQPHEPTFYKTTRLGKAGLPITLLKIRTLKSGQVNGESGVDQVEKSRHYRFGDFMRKTGIDELPQFISILRGDLTLFAPRAIPKWDMEAVRKAVMEDPAAAGNQEELYGQWARAILKERPGLVGLAQLSGSRDLSALQRVKHDLYQIENDSFWLATKMFFKTPLVMINGKGRR